MRRRTRLLVVAGFLLLFAAVPEPDATTGVPCLVRLRVREWLLGDDSPLPQWLAAGSLPPLRAEVRHSPPIEAAAARAALAADYARIGLEWATAHGATVDATRPPLPLEVWAGERGQRAAVPLPDGSLAQSELPLASRWSLLPATMAIVVAVLTQRVLLALLLACLAGGITVVATAVGQAPGLLAAVPGGAAHFLTDALLRRSLGEDFYLRITAFVVFLFMTVGVITRNGGITGLVGRLQRRVTGALSAQLAAFASGLAVFFDDYTNCLLVGTTMRPLTDQNRVSREKLAWLVDTTAAPVAGISVFSTWVAYEMSQYRAPLALVTRPDGTLYTANDAFAVFLATMPFRFYCLFSLLFVLLVIVLRRDFGPMLTAERRARQLGQPLAEGARPLQALDERLAAVPAGVPPRARNAVLPLLVLVVGTLGIMLAQGMLAATEAWTGPGEWLRTRLAHARSDEALFGAAVAAFVVALVLSRRQRLLSWRELLQTSLAATRSLGLAFGILFLAWSLGHLCSDLGTGFYLTAAARSAMHAALLPPLLFVLSGAIAFATGTSFGTMAILLPNVVLLAHQLGTDSGFGGTALMLLAIGAVLEGAIFGDHCSPISDTTVLSCLGCRCDLLAHVTTQLPYALLVMATSLACGYLPAVLFGPQHWPWYLLLGGTVLALVLLRFGRDAGRARPDADRLRT